MVLAPYVGGAATPTMVDSARVGLDYIVENSDYTEKLALGNQTPFFSNFTLCFLNPYLNPIRIISL